LIPKTASSPFTSVELFAVAVEVVPYVSICSCCCGGGFSMVALHEPLLVPLISEQSLGGQRLVGEKNVKALGVLCCFNMKLRQRKETNGKYREKTQRFL